MKIEYKTNLSKKIYSIFSKLVSIVSDTGTALERDVEDFIYNWLKQINYFKSNSDKFGKYRLSTDHLERSVVWGLIKGSGRKTVILLHHHDVVDAIDYGVLKKVAFDPEELMKSINNMKLTEDAERDLYSEEWIFGRGTADMKAGAAIQMALLEEYSNKEGFTGNILLLSVPDEECLSLGMREAVNLLTEIKDKFNLEYTLLINSEPHERTKAENGLLYEGSVGKIMPVIHVRGKKAHVKDAFDGFNPILLLSEIVRRTELNSRLSEMVNGDVSPPPSWLYFRDTKKAYDVSIPQSAAGYFSILTLKRSPKEIIEDLKEICNDAFVYILEDMNEKYKCYCKDTMKSFNSLAYTPIVKTFSEVYEDAIECYGEAFTQQYEDFIKSIELDIKYNKINIQESTIMIIEKTLEYLSDISPMVIIALSPPYYPHVTNNALCDVDSAVSGLSDSINSFTTQKWGQEYKKANYFMGISDMSYTALNNSDDVIPFICPNMPLWGNIYNIPLAKIRELNIPSINIGPWGKDLHKFTERVYIQDFLERTPQIIQHSIKHILED